jgi:metal-responsive CopG/Arc/MetJ family transcriptional regulator
VRTLVKIGFWWYIGGMKVKTSVSLSREVLAQLDTLISYGNRSDFIEQAVLKYIDLLYREKRNQNDLTRINAAADRLNAEAKDVLRYQVEL